MNPGVSSSAAYVDSRALGPEPQGIQSNVSGFDHRHPSASPDIPLFSSKAKIASREISRGRSPEAPGRTGNPRNVTAEAPAIAGIPAYPWSARNCHDRPVTPEVAGSSPVAPVSKSGCKPVLLVACFGAAGDRATHTPHSTPGGSRRQPATAGTSCSRSRLVGAGRCAPAEKPEVMTSQAALRRDWDRDQPGALLTPTWLRAANGTRDRNHSPALAVDDRLVRLAQPE
jgi:hypothetical protein